MINLDSLATGPTKVELTRADETLVKVLRYAAEQTHLPVGAVDVHAVGRSDSDSFQDAKSPAICIHSLTSSTYHLIHSTQDTWNRVKMDDYYESYRLITAYVAYLDLFLDAPDAK